MTVITPSRPRGASPLLDLLTRQRDLYRQLKMLSDRQASLIAAGDTDDLLSVLAQRQKLVDGLTAANQELSAYRQAAGGGAGGLDLQAGLSPQQRDEARALMDEVDALLHGIIEQDDRDRQQLQNAQQAVGAQITQAVRGGAAMNAYRSAPQGAAARFTDRRG